MVRDGDCVAIFNSVHRVMEAEKLLKGKGLPILLIPAPRALASDCGLALRYARDARREVEGVLAQAKLLPKDLYLKDGDAFRKLEEES